jgi:hypothetical protein
MKLKVQVQISNRPHHGLRLAISTPTETFIRQLHGLSAQNADAKAITGSCVFYYQN